MRQTHAGAVPIAGCVYFDAFASFNQLVQNLRNLFHGNEMVARFVTVWRVAFAVIQVPDNIKVIKHADAFQQIAIILPINLGFALALEKGFLAYGNAADFVHRADDKIKRIFFQDLFVFMEAVFFKANLQPGANSQLPGIFILINGNGMKIVI